MIPMRPAHGLKRANLRVGMGFGRALAPAIPQIVQTMRAANHCTGTSSGRASTLGTAA